MHNVHALVAGWMRAAGMQVRIDAIGNIRGVLGFGTPEGPRIVLGSHLDTVANAGAFDGILGVVLAISLVEEIAHEGPLPFSIEVIGFSEEEGVRYAKPFLGSLAVVGDLEPNALALTDGAGVTIGDAIRRFGLDPADLESARLDPAACTYLECHIEQGPVLDSERVPIGIVTAIAGQTRMQFTFEGQANHAGTTPMGSLRHDALAAAAEWISAVEKHATETPGLVATVGKLEIPGAAVNVVPGKCFVSLDVRHSVDSVRAAAVQQYIRIAAEAAGARGVTVTHTTTIDQAAVPMDHVLTDLLDRAAVRATGKPACKLVSGAGHDAMIMARKLRTAMLFVRSPGGISHHPGESVLPEDVEAAFATGLEVLRILRDDATALQRLAVATRTTFEGAHA